MNFHVFRLMACCLGIAINNFGYASTLGDRVWPDDQKALFCAQALSLENIFSPPAERSKPPIIRKIHSRDGDEHDELGRMGHAVTAAFVGKFTSEEPAKLAAKKAVQEILFAWFIDYAQNTRSAIKDPGILEPVRNFVKSESVFLSLIINDDEAQDDLQEKVTHIPINLQSSLRAMISTFAGKIAQLEDSLISYGLAFTDSFNAGWMAILELGAHQAGTVEQLCKQGISKMLAQLAIRTVQTELGFPAQDHSQNLLLETESA